MLEFNSTSSRHEYPFKAHTVERQERLADRIRSIFPDFVPPNTTPLAKKKYLDLQRAKPVQRKAPLRFGLPLFGVTAVIGAYIAFVVIPRRQLRQDISAGKLKEIMHKPASDLNRYEWALRQELEEQQTILAQMQDVYEQKEYANAQQMSRELGQYLGKK